ncbi:hypothetical protein LEP1GSC123_1300 [Leptospira borgpetersenii str. 200701203]|uniref:Uncharacterized protein n=1 Tax=Leptospira borgpetersenii str. 200701203 TaxID=1193007 RepID=M3GS23_LEPBO|nr:hypothetical protein LEP1GSC123_1300 [Leptospira borgpetersenii str. 200701203]
MLKRYFPWFGVHVFKQKPVFGKENVDRAYEETIRMIREMSEKNGQLSHSNRRNRNPYGHQPQCCISQKGLQNIGTSS